MVGGGGDEGLGEGGLEGGGAEEGEEEGEDEESEEEEEEGPERVESEWIEEGREEAREEGRGGGGQTEGEGEGRGEGRVAVDCDAEREGASGVGGEECRGEEKGWLDEEVGVEEVRGGVEMDEVLVLGGGIEATGESEGGLVGEGVYLDGVGGVECEDEDSGRVVGIGGVLEEEEVGGHGAEGGDGREGGSVEVEEGVGGEAVGVGGEGAMPRVVVDADEAVFEVEVFSSEEDADEESWKQESGGGDRGEWLAERGKDGVRSVCEKSNTRDESEEKCLCGV